MFSDACIPGLLMHCCRCSGAIVMPMVDDAIPLNAAEISVKLAMDYTIVSLSSLVVAQSVGTKCVCGAILLCTGVTDAVRIVQPLLDCAMNHKAMHFHDRCNQQGQDPALVADSAHGESMCRCGTSVLAPSYSSSTQNKLQRITLSQEFASTRVLTSL